MTTIDAKPRAIECTQIAEAQRRKAKPNSINSNGCSICETGKENYTTFIAGAFRGTEYYQYDYRHTTDGELFSTVAKSLEECRKRRDEWFSKKQK